ncbi:MAG: pseudouridine synthase [Phocaeicola sp.]
MLHSFTTSIDSTTAPKAFIHPFNEVPHPLCLTAAKQVGEYLSTQTQWHTEIQRGKMFGVLVVRTPQNEIQFLAAFSGILAGQNKHPYFVPPVYDFLQPTHYFKQEEAAITAINKEIAAREKEPILQQLREQITRTEEAHQMERAAAKAQLKQQKEARNKLRNKGELSPQEEQRLITESQHQKANYKRLERSWAETMQPLKEQLSNHTEAINDRKKERKERSAALQNYLFQQFQFLNGQGESKPLNELFRNTPAQTPPAGAGECAGPKLLQYAYLHQLTPLALAEFWWGDSPKQEIRHHNHFYAPCKGKCHPIFAHMLQGVTTTKPLLPPSLATPLLSPTALEVLFEDEYLIAVNKPAGMLSVPGKEAGYSLYQWMQEHYPEATGPLVVHRLDMATSGILLLTKSKEAHKRLQQLFESRIIKKQYVALLEGDLIEKGFPLSGEINLPLSADLLDRPRQKVDLLNGKTALTHYQLIACEERTISLQKENTSLKVTRVQLFPLTGRTHQLRLHAAHPEGMNSPILGDTLYGTSAERLYLHAERVDFIHPFTQEPLTLLAKAPF